MRSMRESVLADKFPEFVQQFMKEQYPDSKYPEWVVDSLASVGIQLQGNTNIS